MSKRPTARGVRGATIAYRAVPMLASDAALPAIAWLAPIALLSRELTRE
jgi:hypothetical protein